MYSRTYDKIIKLFQNNNGYMSYDVLKAAGVTVLQMRELEDEGVLEHFSRGWYWCNACGLQKPNDYKYIEIAKIDPEAVICLDSACFVSGLKVHEPAVVKIAVPRTDRKKIECDFALKRYFYTHMEEEYIRIKKTAFGNYRFFAPERAIADCLSDLSKAEPQNAEVVKAYGTSRANKVEAYRKFLREKKREERQEKIGK